MATVISQEEALAHATAVLDRAMAGEEIVIAASGAPKLRLVPVQRSSVPLTPREPGRHAGQFSYSDDAFAPLTDEELKDWGY